MFSSGCAFSLQKKKTSCTSSLQPAEGQVPVRGVSHRGRSMGELVGVLQLCSRPLALSRSSEQLEQLWRNCRRNLDPENPEEPWIHSNTPKGWSSDPSGEPRTTPASSWTRTRTWTQPGPPSPAADMPSSNPQSPPAGLEVRPQSPSPTQVTLPHDDAPASR